jgi:hypothetical protein
MLKYFQPKIGALHKTGFCLIISANENKRKPVLLYPRRKQNLPAKGIT